MLSVASIAPVRPLSLPRTAYHHLATRGTFEGRRVQLVYGTVLEMSPMGTPHANAIAKLIPALARIKPDDLDLRVQLPLAAAEDSEPEPDFAFVRSQTGFEEDHPASAVLIIEIADSSLRLDLGPKAKLYAEMGVPEYWVVDLGARTTHVHRSPKRGRYAAIRRASWSRRLASSQLRDLEVTLATVLP